MQVSTLHISSTGTHVHMNGAAHADANAHVAAATESQCVRACRGQARATSRNVRSVRSQSPNGAFLSPAGCPHSVTLTWRVC
eukprot:6214256-Pleurochrysis_carterae.AAC.1